MSRFGIIPPEPPVIVSLDGLAPQFYTIVLSVVPNVADLVNETLRTDARQAWLYGFGREYDDGRGIVTNAPTGNTSWHKFGLALDFKTPPSAAVAAALRAAGIALGMDWPTFIDPPHIQAGPPMRRSPSSEAALLWGDGSDPSKLWTVVGAAGIG